MALGEGFLQSPLVAMDPICTQTRLGRLNVELERQVLDPGAMQGLGWDSLPGHPRSSLQPLMPSRKTNTFRKAHECENAVLGQDAPLRRVQTNVPGLESSCQKSLCSLLSKLSSKRLPSVPSGGRLSAYCLLGDGRGL